MTPEHNDFAPESLLTHAPWLRALVRSLLRDEAAVEDVVQESFVVALEHRPMEVRSMRHWLGTVARRLALTRGRGEERRQRRERATARCEEVPSTSEMVERLASQERVVHAVIRLPEPPRTTILLRYYEELTPTEIADRLGLPLTTVCSRLDRGLELLRKALAERYGPARWRQLIVPCLTGFGRGPLAPGVPSLARRTPSLVAPALVGLGLSACLLVIFFAWFGRSSCEGHPGDSTAAANLTLRSTTDSTPDAARTSSRTTRVEVPITPHPEQSAGRVAPGTTIHGRLVDPDGMPVPDVEVAVTPFEERAGEVAGVLALSFDDVTVWSGSERGRTDEPVGRSTAVAVTGPDGRFELHDIGEHIPLELGVRDSRWLIHRLPFQLGGSEGVDFGEIRLQPGARLGGHVLDALDEPWRGVICSFAYVGPGSERGIYQGRCPTQADGTFDIGPIEPDRPIMLRLEAPGSAARTFQIDGLSAGEHRRHPTIRLCAAVTLSGRVFDGGGRAIAGAEVMAQTVGSKESSTSVRTTTDEQGRFAFLGIEGTAFEVRSTWNGFRALALDVASGTRDLRMCFDASGAVGGMITERGSDRPVVGAKVELFGASGRMAGATSTDDRGAYVIHDVAPGSYQLSVTHTAFLAGREPVKVAPVERAHVDAQLWKGASLSVLVEDGTGRPVPNATVSITPLPFEEGNRLAFGVMSSWITWGTRRGEVLLVSQVDELAHTRPTVHLTDASGVAVFESLEAGRYSVLAEAAGLAGPVRILELDGSSTVRETERIRLEEEGRLCLRIERSSGAPVKFQELDLTPVGSSQHRVRMTTDADGMARLDGLAAGPYVVSFRDVAGLPCTSGTSEESVSRSVDIRAGVEEAVVWRIRATARLDLHWDDAANRDARILLALLPGDGESPPSPESLRFADDVPLDPAGHRVFERLVPGVWWIALRRPEHALWDLRAVTLAAEEERRVDLSMREGAIEGVVTDRTGKPMAGVRVSLVQGDPDRLLSVGPVRRRLDVLDVRFAFESRIEAIHATTDALGRYRLDNVPQGSYLLSLFANGYGTAYEVVELAAGLPVTRDVHLDEEARVRGIPAAALDGRCASIQARLFDELLSVTSPLETLDVDAGGFQFDGLRPGSYRLQLVSLAEDGVRDELLIEHRFSLHAGQVREVQIDG
ncbi:MAG: sigma-70 family RNA polymerase sigma factor [Planctomycetes bacterium]|nr:sigma-70 family RNA polymerase sigma factor [Planctomycetota bacterium]